MATIPSGSTFNPSSAGVRRAQGMHIHPYSLQQSVQDWGGRVRVMNIVIPPVQGAEATLWTQFFDELNGVMETFTLDISQFFPHDPTANSVAFRLLKPDTGWDVDVASRYSFSFQAIEVL